MYPPLSPVLTIELIFLIKTSFLELIDTLSLELKTTIMTDFQKGFKNDCDVLKELIWLNNDELKIIYDKKGIKIWGHFGRLN